MDGNLNQSAAASDFHASVNNAFTRPSDNSPHSKKTRVGQSKELTAPNLPLNQIVAKDGKCFSILETLAQGGMGVIYKATDTQLNRTVAIKLISSDHEIEKDTQARFQQEAQLASQLQHPNITTIHELGITADKRLYIVMKYIDGETLRSMLRRNIVENNSNANRLLDIFVQVCRAMSYAHSNGIIHRDLKPENIMVGSFGEVQVMDWGLAKQIDPHRLKTNACEKERTNNNKIMDPLQTDVGMVMGTLSYMSPEQSLGNPTCPASDVYSLGILLSEILTSKPTFVSNNDSEPPIDYVLKAQAAWEHRLNRSNQPVQLIELAKQCIQIENSLRPRDASEIVVALEAFQNFQSRNIRKLELKQERAIAKLEAERNRRRQTSRLSMIAITMLICSVISTFLYFSERQSRRAEIVKRRMANFTRKIEAEMQIRNAINTATAIVTQASAVDDRHARLAKLNEALDSILVVKESIDKSIDHDIQRQFSDVESIVANQIETTRSQISFQKQEDETKTRLLNTIRKSQLPGRALNFYTNPELLAEIESTFEEFEISSNVDKTVIAQIVAESSIKGELLSALELWRRLLIKQNKQKVYQEKIAWLTGLLSIVDLDVYRGRLRAAESAQDRQLVVELSTTPASTANLLSAQITSDCLRAMNIKTELEKFLLRAKKKFPNDFRLNHRLAAHYVRTQAANPATLQQLQVCHALQPENPAIIFDLVYCLERVKRYEEAFDYSLELIELAPEFPETYNTLGIMMYHVGMREAAHLAIQQAISMKPNYADAHFNQGLLYECDGELSCALQAATTASKLKPKTKHIETEVNMLSKLGKQEDAILLLRNAIAQRPNFKFHQRLAELFLKTGDLQAAATCFEDAIKFSANDKKTCLQLAQTYLELGQPFEAEFVVMSIKEPVANQQTTELMNQIVRQQNSQLRRSRQALCEELDSRSF